MSNLEQEGRPQKKVSDRSRDFLWSIIPHLFGLKVEVVGTPPDGTESAMLAAYPHKSHLDTVVVHESLKDVSHLLHLPAKAGYWSHPFRKRTARALVGNIVPVSLDSPMGIRRVIDVLSPPEFQTDEVGEMIIDPLWAPALVSLFTQGTRDDPYGAPILSLYAYAAAVSGAPVYPIWVESDLEDVWKKGKWELDSFPPLSWWKTVGAGMLSSLNDEKRLVRVIYGEEISPHKLIEPPPKEAHRSEQADYHREAMSAVDASYRQFIIRMADKFNHPRPTPAKLKKRKK